MQLITSHAAVRRTFAIGALLSASISPVGAQTASGVTSTIVVSDPRTAPGTGYNNPAYYADRSVGSDYSGVVLLTFPVVNGTAACTGSYLGGGKILTAAHCVSNGSTLTSSSFTARFYQSDVGWVDVMGTGYSVKSGYSNAVVNENDVAVLTLDTTAPSWARTYGLASSSVLGLQETFAGYGRTGTGLTGATVDNNQFNDNALLRRGLNTFETTCVGVANDAPLNCVHNTPSADFEGGVFLADFDGSGVSSQGTLCNTFGFCTAGYSQFAEVGIGPGDSGGASFLGDWTITGVASFAQVNSQDVGGFYGFADGFTCVAYVEGNDGCTSNYNFVESQLTTTTPEPGSLLLLASGFAGVLGIRRRRRR